MRYQSGNPILANCDHTQQIRRITDPDYEQGALNAWRLAERLYNNPNDVTTQNVWNDALEYARTSPSHRYSL